MEQITQENVKTLKQMNILSDAIALNQRIDTIQHNPLLHKINEEIKSADELLKKTSKLLKRDLPVARREYDIVMRGLRESQAEIVNYLVKIKKRKSAEEQLKTPSKPTFILSDYGQRGHASVQKLLEKQTPFSALKQVQLKFGDLSLAPKISIKDYKESPLVKKVKINVVPFDLLDFDVRITPEQFDKIPKYMRGRIPYDELKHFLEYTLVPCFNEKYKLLHRKRAAVQHSKEYDLWKVYQSQISYVPGRNFITAGDISRKMERMIDKKTQNLLVMIRHLGIVQEQRISQTVCYIWTATTDGAV